MGERYPVRLITWRSRLGTGTGYMQTTNRVDDSVREAAARHIFRANYSGKTGRDMCLEYFGHQDQECLDHNRAYD